MTEEVTWLEVLHPVTKTTDMTTSIAWALKTDTVRTMTVRAKESCHIKNYKSPKMKHAAGVLEWINFPRYLRNIQADIPTMSIKLSDELAVCIENILNQ